MECPSCTNQLSPVKAGGLSVDACVNGCGGLWFDQLELRRLDEAQEGEGESLLDLKINPGTQVNHDEKRACPKCRHTPMMRHFYSPKRQIEVDHCPECGGHWLDAGELGAIRSLFSNRGERNAYLNGLIDSHFGDDLREVETEQARSVGSMSIMRKMFRFVIPGFL